MAFRWLALAVFVGALFVSAYHRRRARERETIPRRREGGAMMAARALVAFPLFISPLAYVAHPPAMAWASFDAPGWLRWAGVGLGVVVIASVHWVLSNLGRNVSETVLTKESHELVTSGPYRWIRHPLYTTGIALFVALGLIAANWFILLCAAAALVGIRLAVIPREERALRARFGAAYERSGEPHGRHVAACRATTGRSEGDRELPRSSIGGWPAVGLHCGHRCCPDRAVADPVVQRHARARLVQRGARRSIGRLGATAALGGDGAQRDRRHQPAAGGPGRARHPEEGRQRHRRRRRDGCRAQRGRADERRPRRRPVRHHLHREREQALHAERERQGADRRHARAHELARVFVGLGQLGAGIRHAAGRHPRGHGSRRGLGLGRSAASLRNAHVQGDAAAGHRLRRAGLSGLRTHRARLAACRRASGRRRAILAGAARSWTPMPSRRGT